MAVDFFCGKLPSADLYLLGHILHDWDDEKCMTILQNVSEALQPGDLAYLAYFMCFMP